MDNWWVDKAWWQGDEFDSVYEYVQHIEAENERLREALWKIYIIGRKCQLKTAGSDCGDIARAALADKDGE